jgi:type IV secretory pathway VirB3-like protein
MDILNSIGTLLGSSWASGINLYMTTAGLGIAQRMHWINLPGDMKILSNPLIILVAVVMYVVEFVADKIPFFDSLWDTAHTFIRPIGGVALGYMASSHMGPVAQIPVALLTGAVSLNSHLTKATSRVAINSTTPPGTNSVASVTEDASVFGVLYLIIKHPIIASILVILFIIFSIWFLRKMFRFLKRVLRFIFRSEEKPSYSS